MSTYQHNFNSGPSAVYPEVKVQAIEAIKNWDETGISIFEYGHRTPKVEDMVGEAIFLSKKLMSLGDDFEVALVAGGATLQGYQIPLNFLRPHDTGAYLDTGVWSKVAIVEAERVAKVEIVASAASENYSFIPKEFRISKDAQYLHITCNNTAFGTEWKYIPDYNGMPIIADMTSNIFSRTYEYKKCSLIYAGAQKLIGIAGASLVAIRKDFLSRQLSGLPPIMDYKRIIAAGSRLNTPPVFNLYVLLLTLRHMDKLGGVQAIEKVNKEKSDTLYNVLERYPQLYQLNVRKEDRSDMNVCFFIKGNGLEEKFLKLADEQGMYGVKGHALVGGIRVAIYNAVPLESVRVLADLLASFANAHL